MFFFLLSCSSAPRTSISVAKTVSSTIVSTSAVAGSSGAVTSTSSANTSMKSVSGLINGSTSQKKDMSPKVKESSSSSSSPTTSGRVTSGSSPKSERLSSSPDKQHQDRRSNGTSPKPNTSKSKCIPGTFDGSNFCFAENFFSFSFRIILSDLLLIYFFYPFTFFRCQSQF